MPKVYIASMRLRGPRAEAPDGTVRINVTSAQLHNNYRRDFSPMSFKDDDRLEGFGCFESLWQSLKKYEGTDDKWEEKHQAWWRKQTKGKRRYPAGKDKRVTHAEYNGKHMNYIQSRKEFYIPRYLELTEDTWSMKHCQKLLEDGKDIVIYDFDGPKGDDGELLCLEVTEEMLKNRVNDPQYPFGHGFVIAACLASIPLESYIN